MVPGSFSRFILVYWTRPTLNYANYLVPGSFSRFILVHWTRPTLKYTNYMDPGSFLPLFSSFLFSPVDTSNSKYAI